MRKLSNMNRAIAVEWDNGPNMPKVWKVWYPVADHNGKHLSTAVYVKREIAENIANRWNKEHGIV